MKNTVKLNKNRDFRRLYFKGKSLADPLLIVYFTKSRTPDISHIGITATKKIGKANKRNRARRLIIEAYRALEPKIEGGWDFVFVARTKTTFSNYHCVLNAMSNLLKKGGVLQ
jgi:ribonuclease P protein component